METVVLLSHKKADSYIHIDVEFGEGEGKIPVDSIAKRAEAYKPKEKVTYKMIKEYIEAKYGFKVHTAYIAEVKRNLGLPMYDACSESGIRNVCIYQSYDPCRSIRKMAGCISEEGCSATGSDH